MNIEKQSEEIRELLKESEVDPEKAFKINKAFKIQELTIKKYSILIDILAPSSGASEVALLLAQYSQVNVELNLVISASYKPEQESV
jgi:hypothetical protein